MLLRPGLAAAGLLLITACPADDPALGDGSGPSDTSTTDASTGADTSSSTGAADDSTTGAAAECGNGMVEAGEECDDGTDNADNAACTLACVAAACGDGLVHEGVEACDDGNDVDDDECSNACLLPAACGDGAIQAPEECDDGRANAEDGACKPDCTAAFCGDGAVQDGVEQCDDADADNDDECTQLCAPPTCGDGFPQIVNSELCDDGDDQEGDECNADCTTAGLWTDTYNGPDDNVDEIHGVALDSAGNVIVAGETFVTGQGDDVWLRKYSPAGAPQWTQTFHGVTSDVGWSVAVASDDDILVGGSTYTLDNGRDAWVRRYTPAGATDWTQTFDGAAHDDDEVRGIAVDPSGNVIAVGYVTTAAAQRDVWVRKYDPDGNELWTATYDAPQHGSDMAHGVAVDGADAIVVAGSIFRGTQSDNVWVRKYDPDGNELWTSTYNSDGFGSDVGNAVAVDADGNVAAGGFETRTDLGEFRNAWVRYFLQ